MGPPLLLANDVIEQLKHQSDYICIKGLELVRANGLVEAIPQIVERILDDRTEIDLKRRFIDTLVELDSNEALSAAVTTAHNLHASAAKKRLRLPAELRDAADVAGYVATLETAIANHPSTYLIRRLSRLRLLRDGSVVTPFLQATEADLVKTAALLAVAESKIPHTDLVDALIALSRDETPIIRALAYRALGVMLPRAELAQFLSNGLDDTAAIVRVIVLETVVSRTPPGFEEKLTALFEREQDDRVIELIQQSRAALTTNWWLDLLAWFFGLAIIACIIAGCCAIPYLLDRRRRRQFEHGLSLMKQAEYGRAAEEFKQVMERAPSLRERAHLHLLRALVRSNEMVAAAELFETFDGHHQELDDLYALATDVDGKGLKARAVALYLQILERDASYADVQSRFDKIDERFGGGGKGADVKLSSSTSLTDLLATVLSGEYETMKLVGKGGMGAVFSALNKKTNEKVAIKVLSPHLADKEAIRTRFYRESVAIANLSHPNICGIRDIRKADLPFIIMEFIDGKSLKELLEEATAPMDRDRFFSIAIPVTDALAYAHSKKIVHRDIKPENILVTPEGIPKVVDFGLVKFKETASDITSTGAMMGTPMYMSPEQLKGEALIDARTDLFSLGLTFYEMLTLGYPFPKKAVFQRVFMEARPLRELNKTVPAQVESIVLNCIQNDPDERPDSAEELKSLLETSREYWAQ